MKIDTLFPTRWLHPEQLGGRAVVVTIQSVTLEEMHNQTTNKKEMKPAVAFVGKTKLLILNKTQALAIARITGQNDTDNWAGKKVTLSATVAPNGKQTIMVSPVPDANPNPVAGTDPAPHADPDPVRDADPDRGGGGGGDDDAEAS